ncbi:major structural subunit of bundle-forming pilus [Escherichia coli 2-011-08_S3_C3]|uniref:type 4 pilus major pilin n=1 Tax=Escherichia coli TaxID=562 RepID=UPI000461576F|nr:type 4 pilus major pilin [Escherichia coli]EFF6164405.1 pilus assembly protein [Escherichia coli]EFG1434722.1 pilus assembly protein [Escherichia coli]ELW2944323.1 pilus assembly protein [Escherichia coli]KDA84704.1 major structural subunit of bundle-forming pilus [Escherichia coli 2-011-08_S3_C3]KDS99762.1 major structural subunit of bundle-forming pilus [Escherichia coli 2-011-08_S3_C1]
MNIFTKKVFDKKAQKRKSSLLFQKGLSLIEASMVLALSAIVVSGVMYYYQAASDNNKTQSTVSEVMSIVSAVNGLFVGTADYAGLTAKTIIDTSAIPDNYKKGTQIMHPFGGEVNLGQVNKGGYYIVLNDVPKGPCVNLASMNFGTSLHGVGVGVDYNQAAQGNVTSAPTSGSDASSGKIYDKALTPAQAAKACSNNTNKIAFLLK